MLHCRNTSIHTGHIQKQMLAKYKGRINSVQDHDKQGNNAIGNIYALRSYFLGNSARMSRMLGCHCEINISASHAIYLALQNQIKIESGDPVSKEINTLLTSRQTAEHNRVPLVCPCITNNFLRPQACIVFLENTDGGPSSRKLQFYGQIKSFHNCLRSLFCY